MNIFTGAATGFPLIVLSCKSTKPLAAKVASVGRSFAAGFVAFTACGLTASIPAAAHPNLSAYAGTQACQPAQAPDRV